MLFLLFWHVLSSVDSVINDGPLYGESARVNVIGYVINGNTVVDAENGEPRNVPALPEPMICTSVATAALAEHVAKVTQTETRFKSEFEVKYFIEWR